MSGARTICGTIGKTWLESTDETSQRQMNHLPAVFIDVFNKAY